jgi:hypothetical protein
MRTYFERLGRSGQIRRYELSAGKSIKVLDACALIFLIVFVTMLVAWAVQ